MRGLEEYQESEFDVSTDFPLLSRQLQPQEIHSGGKSGISLPIISLKTCNRVLQSRENSACGCSRHLLEEDFRDIL